MIKIFLLFLYFTSFTSSLPSSSFFILSPLPPLGRLVVKEQLFFLLLPLCNSLAVCTHTHTYIYSCVYKRSIKWRQQQEVYDDDDVLLHHIAPGEAEGEA